MVRSSLPPSEVMADVRAALKRIDPDLALGNFQTMGDLVTAAVRSAVSKRPCYLFLPLWQCFWEWSVSTACSRTR